GQGNGFEVGVEQGWVALVRPKRGGITVRRRCVIQWMTGLTAAVVQETEMGHMREAREGVVKGLGLVREPIEARCGSGVNTVAFGAKARGLRVRQGGKEVARDRRRYDQIEPATEKGICVSGGPVENAELQVGTVPTATHNPIFRFDTGVVGLVC